MAPGRVLLLLASSLWLRGCIVTLTILAIVDAGLYAWDWRVD